MKKVFISRYLSPDSPFFYSLPFSDFEIFAQSLLEFKPVPFSEIPDSDWIFFYSKTGVQYFFETVREKKLLFSSHLRWAAIGPATSRMLKKHQIQVDFTGDGQAVSTAAFFLKLASGQRVLFPRARHSKKSIQKQLEGRIQAIDLIVYDNIIQSSFSVPQSDILIFTSPLNATAYFQKYSLLPLQCVIAIGSTTADMLHNLGIEKVLLPDAPNELALVKLLLSL